MAAFLFLAMLVFAPTASARSGFFSPTGSMSTGRLYPAAAPLPDGRVLVAGGYHYADVVAQDSAEVFDPATGSFSPTGSMTAPRVGAIAASLRDGRVLIAGGDANDPSSAEVFDPTTGSFSPTGSMIAGTVSGPALLPDGRVLFFGVGGSSSQVFDPATDTFSSVGFGSMSGQRHGPAVAPLPDGRILVAGGYEPGKFDFALASAEIFNADTGTFSPTGSMSVSREGAAAAPLPDGVLVVGAYWPGEQASAEFFDAASGTFSRAGIASMSVPRYGPAAAPLPGGRVLVVGGGRLNGDALSSAEIFAPITCRGTQATIAASNGDDRGLRATPGADVVVGLAGNDEVYGLNGNDVICGEAGKDTLSGQNGKDKLNGQEDNDTLTGGAGKDVLKGAPGKDILIGGPGDDVLKGGPGRDVLKGGPGTDREIQ